MISLIEDVNIKGYRLLIPSTCVGNTSQLTCDLLIENFRMKKVGDVFHSSIIPLVGPSAFGHVNDTVTTAAELFISEEHKLAVLQLRTPLAAPLMADFFKQFSIFTKERQVQEVIILTASYGYEKHTVAGCDFGYRANKGTELSIVPAHTDAKILGGGFALQLLEALTVADISGFILFKYVSEGDNIPDAISLLLKLNEIINIFDKDTTNTQLRMPISWKFLFGNRPPMEIY